MPWPRVGDAGGPGSACRPKGFLTARPRVHPSPRPSLDCRRAGRGRVGTPGTPGSGLPGRGGGDGFSCPVLLPQAPVSHPLPRRGEARSDRGELPMGGQWASGRRVSPAPASDRWLQPSLGVGTVWSRGGSPHAEQQKGLDSEPGSASWHLCSRRARWQPRPGQQVSVRSRRGREWGGREGGLGGCRVQPGNGGWSADWRGWGGHGSRWRC